MKNQIKLNVGCGKDIKKDFINIDLEKGEGVDLVIDFNKDRLINYYNEDTVDYILCSHMLEHLIDPVTFILDCHKILKKGKILLVKLPTTLRTGLFHMRTGHTTNYFWSLGRQGRGYQGKPYFHIKTYKNRKHYKTTIEYFYQRYNNFKEWFLRQIYDEYIYRLIKK